MDGLARLEIAEPSWLVGWSRAAECSKDGVCDPQWMDRMIHKDGMILQDGVYDIPKGPYCIDCNTFDKVDYYCIITSTTLTTPEL